MKKILLSAISLFAAVSLWAGVIVAPESKLVEKMVEQEMPAECFAAGELQFDVYAAWATSTSENTILENNGWGGGIGINYFITRYFGIGIDGTWLAVDQTLHAFSGSLIARLPFEGPICWAPYLFIGGGAMFDSSSTGEAHVGGGFDIRLTPSVGILLDSRYNCGGRDEWVLTRLGLRFIF